MARWELGRPGVSEKVQQKKGAGGGGGKEARVENDKRRDLTAELHNAPPWTLRDTHPGSRRTPNTPICFIHPVHRHPRETASVIHFGREKHPQPLINVLHHLRCRFLQAELLKKIVLVNLFQLPHVTRDQRENITAPPSYTALGPPRDQTPPGVS